MSLVNQLSSKSSVQNVHLTSIKTMSLFLRNYQFTSLPLWFNQCGYKVWGMFYICSLYLRKLLGSVMKHIQHYRTCPVKVVINLWNEYRVYPSIVWVLALIQSTKCDFSFLSLPSAISLTHIWQVIQTPQNLRTPTPLPPHRMWFVSSLWKRSPEVCHFSGYM